MNLRASVMLMVGGGGVPGGAKGPTKRNWIVVVKLRVFVV